MHYIKYGVNSSLFTYFWLLQVYGTLDHCFITTHTIHNESDLQIYFGVIFLKTRCHAQPTSHLAHLYIVPFSCHEKNTDGSRVWLMISLASACYGDSRVTKHLLRLNLVFQRIWGWCNLGSFQLPQSNSSPEGA